MTPPATPSTFGSWTTQRGLPAFRYTADPSHPRSRWDPLIDPETGIHWLLVGNRRLQLLCATDGTTAIWDTANGYRWLTAAEPGTGVSVVTDAAGTTWGTDAARWPATIPERTFGPTWFTVAGASNGVMLERTVFTPEGDVPWVLVRVALGADEACRVDLVEEWNLAGRFVNRQIGAEPQRDIAARATRLVATEDAHGVTVAEHRTPASTWEAAVPDGAGPAVFGPPVTLRLQATHPVEAVAFDAESRTATIRTAVDLRPDTETTLWFAIGLPDDEPAPPDPQRAWDDTAAALQRRLPRATAPRVPHLDREVPWHAAVLTGGAAVDHELGGHTLDQSSAYTFRLAFNGAARDPLQHALPLVYSEPDLALSVLRNTCAWGAPDGSLPYALDGSKRPLTDWYDPSDQALWAFWLAVEYVAATGDLAAFHQPAPFHPRHEHPPMPLGDHLRRQFRHLVDHVGFGSHGHLHIRNADWNDSALTLAGIERSQMQAHGESVLNSAMAAWVLPRYAGLARALDDAATADEADDIAGRLRALVAGEWNGRWFRRAYGPDAVVGDADMWLEVQPWAILCGATDEARSGELLRTIDDVVRSGSPLGARLRGPVPISVPDGRVAGEGTSGGIWFSINMTLAWAAASAGQHDLAWDELSRMTLGAHTAAYPDIWEGTTSGPDAYNAPESPRPGRTWGWAGTNVAMQAFPVNNLHAHSQVLLTYLRLLGVEPTPQLTLRVGAAGASFDSPTFSVRPDGHGRAQTSGPITVESHHEIARGSGRLSW